MFLRQNQVRFVESASQFVNSFDDAFLADDSTNQDSFAGKVDQGQAEKNGQQALAGQDQHGDACQDEDDTYCIFDNDVREIPEMQQQMAGGLLAPHEEVMGQGDDNQGDHDQGPQKHQQ